MIIKWSRFEKVGAWKTKNSDLKMVTQLVHKEMIPKMFLTYVESKLKGFVLIITLLFRKTNNTMLCGEFQFRVPNMRFKRSIGSTPRLRFLCTSYTCLILIMIHKNPKASDQEESMTIICWMRKNMIPFLLNMVYIGAIWRIQDSIPNKTSIAQIDVPHGSRILGLGYM